MHASATPFTPFTLPEPQLEGGLSLVDAFRLRRTEREFSDRPNGGSFSS